MIKVSRKKIEKKFLPIVVLSMLIAILDYNYFEINNKKQEIIEDQTLMIQQQTELPFEN